MRKWILGAIGALLVMSTGGAHAQNIVNRNPTSVFVLDQRTNPNVICIPRDNSSGLCNGSAAPNVFATWDGTNLNFGLGIVQNALILAEQNRALAAEGLLLPKVGAFPLTLSSDLAGLQPGCPSTIGAYAPDGTLSWVPSCFGTFAATGQSVSVYPTRGTPKDANGNPSYNMMTDFLVQARGDGAIPNNTNGMFTNFETIGGVYSETHPGDGQTNATGHLISVLQHPDLLGNRPPYTWGQNIDFHIGAGSGNVQSYGTEIDMNNFNQDCAPGSGCLSAAIFLNGINGFDNTAWVYSGGGTTNNISGTVTTAGTAVTLASGQQFLSTLRRITIAGIVYRVTYVDGSHLTVTSAAPPTNATPVAYTASNDAVHKGFFLQGSNNVADDDYYTATSAYSAFTSAGNHNVVLNAANDNAGFAVLMKTGQNACFNAFANCLYFDGNILGYQTPGNGRVFGIDGLGTIQTSSGKVQATGAGSLSLGNTVNGTGLIVADAGGTVANQVFVQPSTVGFGPAIKATGSDTNVPLNIYAKGASPIQMQSGITVAGSVIATGPLIGSSLRSLTNTTMTIGNVTNGPSVSVLDPGANAVNTVSLQGSATGVTPVIGVLGTDTNVGLNFVAKGAAALNFIANGNGQFRVTPGPTGSVNQLQVYGNIAGSAPVLGAIGSDVNISIALVPKGTGQVNAATGGYAVAGNSVIDGTGAGTLLSLAVTNNATVGGTLGVTGNGTIGGTLGVTGNTSLSSLTASGAATLGSLGVIGNGTVGGTLGVTGATTLASLGVTGNETVGGTLGVTGTVTAGNLTTAGIVTANGASSTFGQSSNASTGLILNAATGGKKRFITQTAGSGRWEFGQDATAETGSNVGGLFYLQAHNDDGSFGPMVLTADRVTGGIKFLTGLTANALPTTAGTAKGTVCSDTNGVLYVKTTTGACL
jgi:hypothetical protein